MIELLTVEERMSLPQVTQRRLRFTNIVAKSIQNYANIFSNSLLLSGKAGTGKTTLVLQELEKMKALGDIADYVRVSGHVTPQSLYRVLRETKDPVNGKPRVLVLDDVDCISQASDIGCYELLKSALDTKSDLPSNRQVYYLTECGSGFKYNGFCIIITNNPFNPNKITAHQEALLDRVQMVGIDLKKDDMFLYNANLVEEYINDNPDGLTDEEIQDTVNLFNDEVRDWQAHDAFSKAKVNFSIRLMKKFIEANRMFGSSWKSYNLQYQRLQAAVEMDDAMAPTTPVVDISALINPKTGKPYSKTYQNILKKKMAG